MAFRKLREVAALLLAAATLVLVVACDNGSTDTGPPTPGGPTPTSVPQALQAGQRIYQQYCNRCHPNGYRGIGPSLINSARSDEQITSVIRRGHNPMPAYGPDTIPDTDMPPLIAYIRALR
ncbi:MAG: c-type cytochrome [Chloroflexia bacterium]